MISPCSKQIDYDSGPVDLGTHERRGEARIDGAAVPRLGSGMTANDAGRAFGNLTFYGTLGIYLEVAGGKPLVDLVRFGHTEHESIADSHSDALGTLGMLILAVVFWGWIVGAGQTAAIQAFL